MYSDKLVAAYIINVWAVRKSYLKKYDEQRKREGGGGGGGGNGRPFLGMNRHIQK